jgi:hypothetical protein
MMTLPANATDDEILAVVRQWVDLLAQGDYVQAQSLLKRDGAERDWPRELVAELIGSYELPPAVDTGEKSRVTPVGEARVADVKPRASVSRWEKSGRANAIGDVHFDLLRNGLDSSRQGVSAWCVVVAAFVLPCS